MIKPGKAQIAQELFKYMLVGMFSIIVLIGGYKLINAVNDGACKTEIGKFEIDLRNIDKSLRFGTKELRSYDAPCNVDKIYFFDLNKKIDPGIFNDTPVIKDALKNRSKNNLFIVKEGDVKRSFYAGSLKIEDPYYLCLIPKNNKLSFFIESTGESVRITLPSDELRCT